MDVLVLNLRFTEEMNGIEYMNRVLNLMRTNELPGLGDMTLEEVISLAPSNILDFPTNFLIWEIIGANNDWENYNPATTLPILTITPAFHPSFHEGPNGFVMYWVDLPAGTYTFYVSGLVGEVEGSVTIGPDGSIVED